jgi:uncharacterized protein YndB with AHSA1/START domain
MPVKIDASGRRSVEAEVEVPGTPEEVWEAIATGPGISSWFVPTTVEEHVGGAVLCDFGPGMESVSTVTTWDPPHRFVADSRDDMGPDDPSVATEWIVESRSGGNSVVRVVHSWFTSSDAWDDQFEGHTYGWISFFRVLRLYLTYFRGQPSAAFQQMGVAPEPKSEAWAALIGLLGLEGAEVGHRVRTSPSAPPLAGIVEWAGQPAWSEELLLRLDEPAPGIAHLVPHAMGGQVYLTIRFYLYGDHAPGAVALTEPMWQGWVNEHFPFVASPEAVASG